MYRGKRNNRIQIDNKIETSYQNMTQSPQASVNHTQKDTTGKGHAVSPACPLSLESTFSRLYSTDTASSSMRLKERETHNDSPESTNDHQRKGITSTSRRLFMNGKVSKTKIPSTTDRSTRKSSSSKGKNNFLERLYKKETESSLQHKSKESPSQNRTPTKPHTPESNGQIFERLYRTKTSSSAQKHGAILSQCVDTLLSPRKSQPYSSSPRFYRFNNITNSSARRVPHVGLFTPQAKVRSHAEMMTTFQRLSSTTTASSRTKIHREKELILDR